MKPIKALYIDWHTPRRNNGNILPVKKPWEIVMIIRSVHFARKFNNLSPVLYCDIDTYNYYDKIGLLKHFDEVRPILPMNTVFNTSIFWAAGKFYAIMDCDDPFIIMDLDAEIRFTIDYGDCDVYCAHLERINPNDIHCYPEVSSLDKENYIANNFGIEWSDYACNTCIMSFSDLDFAKEYAGYAIKFMEDFDETKHEYSKIFYIVLIEQRFLYEFARSRGKKIGTLISGFYLPYSNGSSISASFENSDVDEIADRGFFHVWGFKNNIAENQTAEDDFFATLVLSVPEIKDSILEVVLMNHNHI
jgi:hypothetical protein